MNPTISRRTFLRGAGGAVLFLPALETLAEGLRHEVARFNVEVIVIEPGLFKTAMPKKIAEGYVCKQDSAYADLVEYLQARSRSGTERGEGAE